MRITELIWPRSRVEHIARHGVRPEEVEEVCRGKYYAKRGTSFGKNPVYEILGRTYHGRYLFCLIIRFPDGKGYPVTARPMTAKERRRYNHWRRS